MHLVNLYLRVGHHLAHGHSVHHGRDGDLALAVLALDGGRGVAFHHCAYVAYTHLRACGSGDGYVLYVGYVRAAFRLVHHLDVVLLAVFAELGRDCAVDAVTQGVCHGLHVQPVHGQLLAVEIHVVFRLVVSTGYGDVGGAVYAFENLLEGGCHGVGLGEIIAVDFEIHRVLATHAHASAAAHVDLCLLELRGIP